MAELAYANRLQLDPASLTRKDLLDIPLDVLSKYLSTNMSSHSTFSIYVAWLEVRRNEPTKLAVNWPTTISQWTKALRNRGFSDSELIQEISIWKNDKSPSNSVNNRYPPMTGDIGIVYTEDSGRKQFDHYQLSHPSDSEETSNLVETSISEESSNSEESSDPEETFDFEEMSNSEETSGHEETSNLEEIFDYEEYSARYEDGVMLEWERRNDVHQQQENILEAGYVNASADSNVETFGIPNYWLPRSHMLHPAHEDWLDEQVRNPLPRGIISRLVEITEQYPFSAFCQNLFSQVAGDSIEYSQAQESLLHAQMILPAVEQERNEQAQNMNSEVRPQVQMRQPREPLPEFVFPPREGVGPSFTGSNDASLAQQTAQRAITFDLNSEVLNQPNKETKKTKLFRELKKFSREFKLLTPRPSDLGIENVYKLMSQDESEPSQHLSETEANNVSVEARKREIAEMSFKNFTKDFKVNSRIPPDLIPILAKDPVKQEEIRQKSHRNAEE